MSFSQETAASAANQPGFPLPVSPTHFPCSSSNFPSMHFSVIREPKRKWPKLPFHLSLKHTHPPWLLAQICCHVQVLFFSLSCLISHGCNKDPNGKENESLRKFPMLPSPSVAWQGGLTVIYGTCSLQMCVEQKAMCVLEMSLSETDAKYTGVVLLSHKRLIESAH